MMIRFIGALGTVTGSCTLLNYRNQYYLVDCGVEQGCHLNANVFGSFDFKPEALSAVFLTHAHLDHCGSLPLLVRQGFRGKIYCSRATANLARLALTNAATLPAAGYSAADVSRLDFVCLDERADFEYGQFFGIDHNLTVAMIRTSHVLGSVGFEFQFSERGEGKSNQRKTIVFSGDIGVNVKGNCYQPLLNDRQYPSTHAEYLVCESTYGGRNRHHEYTNYEKRQQALKAVLLKAAQAGSGATVIFPCFTLQRLQDLVIDLHCLLECHLDDHSLVQICCRDIDAPDPRPSIIIDSPLAQKYGEIFIRELLRTRSNGKPFYLNSELIQRLRITDPAAVRQIVISGLEHERVRTSCLGFGDDYNEDLMADLARATNGQFYDAESPESLPAIFASELDGLQKTCVQNLRVRIQKETFCEHFVQLGGYNAVNGG